MFTVFIALLGAIVVSAGVWLATRSLPKEKEIFKNQLTSLQAQNGKTANEMIEEARRLNEETLRIQAAFKRTSGSWLYPFLAGGVCFLLLSFAVRAASGL